MRPKSKKWTTPAFAYMLDIARINTMTISALNQEKSPKSKPNKSFKFGWSLAMSLLTLHMQRHATNSNGLPKYIVKSMHEFLGIQNVSTRHAPQGPRKKCSPCIEECDRTGQKQQKGNLGITPYRCDTCKEPLCCLHMLRRCPNCVSETLR